MVSKNELNKYYRGIKHAMPCSLTLKHVFLRDFKTRINEFLQDNRNVTMKQIVEEFGNPEEIAKSFNVDDEYYKNEAHKRLVILCVLIGLIVVSLAVGVYEIIHVINYNATHIVITN